MDVIPANIEQHDHCPVDHWHRDGRTGLMSNARSGRADPASETRSCSSSETGWSSYVGSLLKGYILMSSISYTPSIVPKVPGSFPLPTIITSQ